MFSFAEILNKSWWGLVGAVAGLLAILSKMCVIMYRKDLQITKNEIKNDLDNVLEKRHIETLEKIDEISKEQNEIKSTVRVIQSQTNNLYNQNNR